jgi:nucleoside-diphosphate-sugar epimerase
VSEWKANNIYITGATGFIGKNFMSFLTKNKLNCIELNLRKSVSQFSFDKGDCIIHLAGKAHDVDNTTDPSEYYKVNFELTKLIFDQFLNSNASKFIYLSSVKAAADTSPSLLKETDIASPRTDYGKSKLMAEQYMLNKVLPNGKNLFILRPCMVHGPENKGNLNLLYQILKKGIPWPLGSFENKRSFLSIGNLNFIIYELIIQENIKSGIYNVADDTPISTNDLVYLINCSLGKKNTILNIPKWIIIHFFSCGDLFNLQYNSQTLQKLTENYIVDNCKIVNAIGKPLPINSKDGLLLTLLSFKST